MRVGLLFCYMFRFDIVSVLFLMKLWCGFMVLFIRVLKIWLVVMVFSMVILSMCWMFGFMVVFYSCLGFILFSFLYCWMLWCLVFLVISQFRLFLKVLIGCLCLFFCMQVLFFSRLFSWLLSSDIEWQLLLVKKLWLKVMQLDRLWVISFILGSYRWCLWFLCRLVLQVRLDFLVVVRCVWNFFNQFCMVDLLVRLFIDMVGRQMKCLVSFWGYRCDRCLRVVIIL